MPKYEMYLKLMIDGIASSPFSAKGLPPLSKEEKTGNTEKVISYTREKYASDRETVEEKIMRWHENYLEESKEEKAVKKSPAAPANLVKSSPAPAPLKKNPAVSVRPVGSSQAPAGVVSSSASPAAARAAISAVASPVPNRPRIVKSGYDVVCDSCGQPTVITFVPDGVRPVYCKDCLGKKKEEKRLELEKRQQAKEAERRHFAELEEEEDAAAPPPATLSLTDLNKVQPVDFKGRSMKISQPLKSIEGEDAEGELSEGEEINIKN